MILHDLGRSAQYLARIYHELGYDVTIGFINPEDVEDIVPLSPDVRRVIIGANSTFELAARTRPYAVKTDFLHCNFCLSPVITGYVCRLMDGKRYIAHARGDDIRYNIYRWFGPLIKHAIRKADLFFVSTPDLLRVGKSIREDVVWIPNPLDEEVFKPTKPEIDLHQGFDYAIFMPGRIDFRAKGTDRVVEEFARLPPNFSLHLIKHGISSDYHHLIELIEKLGVKDRVFIHDRLLRKDMVQFYNASDMIIDQFGGLHAFGNVTLEGLACEKTVIADYDGAVYPEKPTVTVTPVEELVNTILKLAEDPQLRNPAGREWVLKYHSFQRVKELISKELKQAGLTN